MAKKKSIVKSTRSSMTFICIAILILGWLMAGSYILSAEDPVEEQNAMIKTAKGYLEDKLYIRAVNQYKNALSAYQTDNNDVYEKELLAIYKEGGMSEEYYALIDSRIEAGTAQVEEYSERAQKYAAQSQNANAMSLLKHAMELFEDDSLVELYESISYEYSSIETAYTSLQMPSTDWYIPAFDGEHWGYIGENGRTRLDFIYDEATGFDGDYAVVKIDGQYVLIDKQGYWNAVDKNGLDAVTGLAGKKLVGRIDGKYKIYTNTFSPYGDEFYENIYLNDNGMFVVMKDGKWRILNADLSPLTETQFTDVAVNCRGQIFCKGYAMVADERGYFLINENGEECFESRFPDAKGMEGGLCAVADNAGKWGFINQKGEVIVKYQYEDAFSFSDRLAAVQFAGKWGYINRYNTMIMEAQYNRAFPFLVGTAMAVNERQNYVLLTLKQYDLFE